MYNHWSYCTAIIVKSLRNVEIIPVCIINIFVLIVYMCLRCKKTTCPCVNLICVGCSKEMCGLCTNNSWPICGERYCSFHNKNPVCGLCYDKKVPENDAIYFKSIEEAQRRKQMTVLVDLNIIKGNGE